MNSITPYMKNPHQAYSKLQMLSKSTQNLGEIRKKLAEAERNGQDPQPRTVASQTVKTTVMESILNNTKSYGETIRTQRQQTKETSTEKKKFNYHFKNLSAQIIRSKTSTSARQVVSMAMREVMRLKREKQSGKYDSEEVEAAILHAESMERVARKKVKHLEQEELAKASGSVTVEEERQDPENNKIPEKDKIPENDKMPEDENASAEYNLQKEPAEQAGRTEELVAAYENLLQEAGTEHLKDLTGEMLDEISDAMKDLMEELGIDPEDGEGVAIGQESDPQDLKEMQIRHRNKEMKEIVKADSEYLKAIFDSLEKQKNAGLNALNSQNAGSADLGGATDGGLDFGYAGGPAAEGAAQSIDIAV